MDEMSHISLNMQSHNPDIDYETELDQVKIDLQGIEAIMMAETKRREESNKAMHEIIENTLSVLQEKITEKVDGHFTSLQDRMESIDSKLQNIETEVDLQIAEMNSTITTKGIQLEQEVNQAKKLMLNIQSSKQVQG